MRWLVVLLIAIVTTQAHAKIGDVIEQV
jgi:hypothetical protein